MGNADLKWAVSEAAVLFLRAHPAGQKSLARLERKQGKGQALTVLAHTLARAVYYLWRRDTVFDLEQFLQSMTERSERARRLTERPRDQPGHGTVE
jgi:hypothetical protein